MMSRTVSRASSSVSRRPQPVSFSPRGFSTIRLQPSSVALGKRPRINALPGVVSPLATMSTRNLSWTPWKRTPTDAALDPSTVPETAAGTATPLSSNTAAALQNDVPQPIDSAVSAASTSTSATASASATTTTTPDVVPTAQAAELLPQSPALPSVPSLEELITQSGKPLEEVLASPEAVHAAMKVSDLGLVGLDHGMFSIFGWTRDALVGMHEVSGLPWWATIAALTISIRLCLFPLVVRMTKHNIRFQAVNPQFTALMKRLNEAKQTRDQSQMAVVTQNLQGLMKEHDVSPFRAFTLPLVQMPFFLSMFYGLRNFANTPLPQLKEGGFSWVTDLTMPDPFWILPITSMALTNLVLITGADGTSAAQNGPNAKHVKNFVQVASLIALPFVAKFPAAVLFYWTFTNGFSLLQANVLRIPAIKSLLGIPIPAPVPPPPGNTGEPENPSHMDTFRKLKSTVTDRWANASEQARIRAEAEERSKGMRKGTLGMTERIKETPVAGQVKGAAEELIAPASTASATGFLEETTAKPAKTTSTPGSSEPAFLEESTTSQTTQSAEEHQSREEAKRQRIAAARERRARQ